MIDILENYWHGRGMSASTGNHGPPHPALGLPGKQPSTSEKESDFDQHSREVAYLEAVIDNLPVGLFAKDDRVITAQSVLKFEVALQALAKEFEIEIFTGAGRGFADHQSEKYHVETAALAWSRTVDFLDRHMAAGAN